LFFFFNQFIASNDTQKKGIAKILFDSQLIMKNFYRIGSMQGSKIK